MAPGETLMKYLFNHVKVATEVVIEMSIGRQNYDDPPACKERNELEKISKVRQYAIHDISWSLSL